MDKIYIGAAYYPELWDMREVDKDIDRCKSLGVNVLRIGEFAWDRMEPSEGTFDLDWLVSVVDKLYADGIYTVMCTPTCTPPRRLLDKYTEMRAVGSDGERADVSSRCHVCKTSPVAREKNRMIVTELARSFMKHDGVIGWQIDNELFPYDHGCYCPLCKAAFREYLKKMFGSIDKLNDAWGMARWSLSYDSFDAVLPPYPKQWRHPSLRKAWWDFQCCQIKTFADEQADILHKYGCKNVGTDMMCNNNLSYYDVNEKLDVVMFNHYDRAEDLPKTAFSYDFLRCVKDKPFWVTETQVGWNGSEFAECGSRPIGNCYMNTVLPVAKGAEMNMYWQFRAHRSGHELAHGALFSAAGRAYRVSDEVAKAIADINKCGDFIKNTCIESKIALSYSVTAANCFGSAPMLKDFDYRKTLIEKYYSAFRHYNVDVIDTRHGLDGYDTVISPFLAVVDENDLKTRMIEFVRNGGTWIVGPLTDIMDGNVNKYTRSPYGFLEEFAGVYTKYQKPLDNKEFKARYTDGKECAISACYDAYEVKDGTTSIATYTDCEFAPLSVITERKTGKGKVILVGSVIEKRDLLLLAGKKPIAEASDNIVLTERTAKGGKRNGIIACEVENRSGYIELDGEYIELITDRTLSGRVEIAPYEALMLVKQ